MAQYTIKGLADEEGISLEDDGGDVDEDAEEREADDPARRELEARRRQAVDAQVCCYT